MLNLIVWILIFLLALSFFGISIQAVFNSPAGQSTILYLSHFLLQIWQWITVHIPS